MLHDGKSEAGSTCLSGSRFIHAIKTLGHTWNMLRCDTDPVVLNRQNPVIVFHFPRKLNLSVLRRVADGIRHEISDGASHIFKVSEDSFRRHFRDLNFMRAARNHSSFGHRLLQDFIDIDELA